MNSSGLRLLMMTAFLLAFVAGSVLGFLVSEKSEALSVGQVALFVFLFVAMVGGVGLLENRHLWLRYGGTSFRSFARKGRKAGGNVQPISLGFGLGLVGGWFAATHGPAGIT